MFVRIGTWKFLSMCVLAALFAASIVARASAQSATGVD